MCAQEAARAGLGQITVGICGAAGFSPRLVAILDQFRKTWPSLQMTFVQRRSVALLDSVSEGAVDGAFVRPSKAQQSFVATHLTIAEPVGIAVSAAHPLASRESVGIRDLRKNR